MVIYHSRKLKYHIFAQLKAQGQFEPSSEIEVKST